jgi:hypothetical protein
MATFLGKTITTAEADALIAAYTKDLAADGSPPSLADIESKYLAEIEDRVKAYEDKAAAAALTKSTFDITS